MLLWKEQAEASRSPSRAPSPGLLGPVLGLPYPSGRLTPTRLDMVRPWPPLPPFAPPPPPAPAAAPWSLGPPAWSLLPPRAPVYAAPLGRPFRARAVSAPARWLGRRPRNPHTGVRDWGWGLD